MRNASVLNINFSIHLQRQYFLSFSIKAESYSFSQEMKVGIPVNV